VGKGKPAILKAIQSGKISAVKDVHGEWKIEPAELHRVYPPISKEPTSEPGSKEPQATIGNANGNSILEQEVQFLREKLADLARMTDEQRRDLSGRIEDLRHDRDDLRGERDRLLKVIEEQAGSMRLLTDYRPRTDAPGPNAGRGFWARLRRKA
jgi:chromosome segregation ATPase